MSSADASVDDIWRSIVPRVRERLDALSEAVRSQQWEVVEAEAHRLAGSLGLYGVADGSAAAKELEDAVREGVRDTAGLEAHVDLAREAVERSLLPQEGPRVDVVVLGMAALAAEALAAALRDRGIAAQSGEVQGETAEVLAVVGPDPELVRASTSRFGRIVVVARSGDEVEAGDLRAAGALEVLHLRDGTRPVAARIAEILDPAPPSDEAPMDVLLVEDDEVAARLAMYALDQLGVSVTRVARGDDAIELLSGRRTLPRLVLLDGSLPGADGIEVLAAMREAGTTGGTQVVMLSAHESQLDVDAALALGASSYLPKPFAVQDLMAVVRGALGLT